MSSCIVVPLSSASDSQEAPCSAFTQLSSAPQGLVRSSKSGVRALMLKVEGRAVGGARLSWKRVALDAIAKVRMRHVWIMLLRRSELYMI